MHMFDEIVNKEEALKIYSDNIANKNNYTNCYFSPVIIERWLIQGIMTLYRYEGNGFVIAVEKYNYISIYFNTNDFDWIKYLKSINKEYDKIVIEIVSKKYDNPYDINSRLTYSSMKKYVRYRRKGVDSCIKDYPAEYCTLDDIPYIEMMLKSSFDVIGDDIPSREELKNLIDNSSVICIKNSNILCGYIIFEDKGKTSYIRNVCVREDMRGQHISEKLMDMYLYLHREYKGFSLWCRADNYPAIKLYERYGYEGEGLYNNIYIIDY